jgi:hypothetical protein
MNSCKVKMANKNPQKPSQSKSNKTISPEQITPVTPSQLITYDPHQVTSVKSSFRTIPLGNPSKPSFYSTLISDYDPFAPKVKHLTTASKNKNKYKETTPYFHRYTSLLFYIEHHHRHHNNPVQLADANFSSNLHFTTVHPAKTLAYYSDILDQEGSVEVKTIYAVGSTTKILYHRFAIIKFNS